MNPEKDEHNEVYKEAARLLDWGFQRGRQGHTGG